MTNELDRPVVVDFPLRGEQWVAVNTPGDRVPSHGTDMLGQRFAYDLLMVDSREPDPVLRRRGVNLLRQQGGLLRGLVIGVRTRDCYAWGAEIHAPFDGEIVRAVDGVAERSRIHPLRELVLVVRNAVSVNPLRAAWRMCGPAMCRTRGSRRPPGSGRPRHPRSGTACWRTRSIRAISIVDPCAGDP